jgi:hypothetical protein
MVLGGKMSDKKIKLGLVSNNNFDRKEEFKKLLNPDFFDYFEITSQELNGNLGEFMLPPSSMMNTDKGFRSLDEVIDNIANNIGSANYALGLTNFTIDIIKYQTVVPNNAGDWTKMLHDLSLAIQGVLLEEMKITVYIKGFEKILQNINQGYEKVIESTKMADKFLRDVNEYVKSYNEDGDTEVTFKPALMIGRNVKISPIDIATAGTVYLSPIKVGKNLTFKEPTVRAWTNSLLKAQGLSETPITVFYEDDIASVASLANLIQIFKPELRSTIKELGLSEPIDEFGK